MANKKIGLRDKYRLLTRDLNWETSYQKQEDIHKYQALPLSDLQVFHL